MRCPSLNDLPPPPPGKTGWPWTEESPQLPDKMPDGSVWPKISIVTPSLNQGQFIEESIRSALLQGYPNLEYIIIDGGSNDQSIDIIKKYENWLNFWVSESDKGQSNAINKGFSKASGEIFAFINSDDLYEPRAFEIVGQTLSINMNFVVAGECVYFGYNNYQHVSKPIWPNNLNHFLNLSIGICQPSVFWRSELFKKIGLFNENFNYCFDTEFYLRIGLCKITPVIISDRLARYREHVNTKSKSQLVNFYEELLILVKDYGDRLGLSEYQIKNKIEELEKDLKYVTVFIVWKKRGRGIAMAKFIGMLIRYPSLILERRILGLLRRLFFFRRKDVKELDKFY